MKILSRVMQAEGRKVPWSYVEAIQRRMGKLDVDDEKFTREIAGSRTRSAARTPAQEPKLG